MWEYLRLFRAKSNTGDFFIDFTNYDEIRKITEKLTPLTNHHIDVTILGG